LDPGAQRGENSWDAFVKRHAHSLSACDFIIKKVWTTSGLRDYFILFFINVGTRAVHVSGITDKPNASWMAQAVLFLASDDSSCINAIELMVDGGAIGAPWGAPNFDS
jgi:putative transposase